MFIYHTYLYVCIYVYIHVEEEEEEAQFGKDAGELPGQKATGTLQQKIAYRHKDAHKTA